MLNRKLLHRWSKQHDSSEEKLLGAVMLLFMLNEQISLPFCEQVDVCKDLLRESAVSPMRESSASPHRLQQRSGKRALAFRKSTTFDSRFTERESSGFNTPSVRQMEPKLPPPSKEAVSNISRQDSPEKQ